MKTMEQFKNDAASGKMSLELLEMNGSSDFREGLKGVCKVTEVNKLGFILVNQNGEESLLMFENNSLREYDGDTLTIYSSGCRDLLEPEKAMLAEWEEIQKNYKKENPHANLYWKKLAFFERSPFPWLNGFEVMYGKKLVYDEQDTPKIMDAAIKGDVMFRYRVYMEE